MITITDTFIETALKELLQKSVQFKLKNKIWRSGRIILFKQSGFFIEFILQSKKKEKFEIPIPFNIVKQKERMLFDYTLLSFIGGKNNLLELIDKIQPESKNRFFNIILEIKYE